MFIGGYRVYFIKHSYVIMVINKNYITPAKQRQALAVAADAVILRYIQCGFDNQQVLRTASVQAGRISAGITAIGGGGQRLRRVGWQFLTCFLGCAFQMKGTGLQHQNTGGKPIGFFGEYSGLGCSKSWRWAAIIIAGVRLRQHGFAE